MTYQGVMEGYSWPVPPGVSRPFRHQIVTAVFLAARRRAFCFNDIGTGKTLTAAWVADWLMQRGLVKRTLIIAPKSAASHTWKRELFRTFRWRNAALLLGPREKRIAAVNNPDYDICIINPDGLHLIVGQEGTRWFDLVIVDEQTEFKTRSTRRFRSLRRIVQENDPRLIMMSGEPMPQSPLDIWAPATLVCPDRVPRTLERWREHTMYQVSRFQWRPRPGIERRIAELLAPYAVRFSRDECVDIPDTQYQDLECDLTPEALRLMQQLKAEAAAAVADGTITAANDGVYIAKLLQIACGAVRYDTDQHATSVHLVDVTPKLEAMMEVIRASASASIVYVPYSAPLHLVTDYLTQQGFRVGIVEGSTPVDKRNKMFDNIQQGVLDVLVANPAAMQYGITLTGASTVIWFGLVHSRKVYGQANGRIQRPGQVHKQYIVHLLSSQIERIVYRRLVAHEKMQGALLEYLERGQDDAA